MKVTSGWFCAISPPIKVIFLTLQKDLGEAPAEFTTRFGKMNIQIGYLNSHVSRTKSPPMWTSLTLLHPQSSLPTFLLLIFPSMQIKFPGSTELQCFLFFSSLFSIHTMRMHEWWGSVTSSSVSQTAQEEVHMDSVGQQYWPSERKSFPHEPLGNEYIRADFLFSLLSSLCYLQKYVVRFSSPLSQVSIFAIRNSWVPSSVQSYFLM